MFILVFSLVISVVVAVRHHPATSSADKKITIWEEDLSEVGHHLETNIARENNHRKLFSLSEKSVVNQKHETIADVEPHPLRTDRYLLRVRWRNGLVRKCLKCHHPLPTSATIEFDLGGHARFVSNTFPELKSFVGEWKVAATNFLCRIPVSRENQVVVRDELLLSADLHLNPFGAQPKLTRGVILLGGGDRLRLVLGTFTGEGAGRDMADLSYRERSNKSAFLERQRPVSLKL